MTETELNNMFENPEVTKRACLKPPIGIVAQEDKAKAFWIVIQICSWLRNWKGRQYARIMKINTWTRQETKIDILVGYSGSYDKFQLITNRIADDLIFLMIVRSQDGGKTFEEIWKTFGVEIKDSSSSSDMFIETMPKGEKVGKRHSFRSH